MCILEKFNDVKRGKTAKCITKSIKEATEKSRTERNKFQYGSNYLDLSSIHGWEDGQYSIFTMQQNNTYNIRFHIDLIK